MDIKTLKLMNDSMIMYLSNLGHSTIRNEIIKKILEDEACFFKIDKNDAFIILEDIGIDKKQISHTYSSLVSYDSYFYLKKSGKIDDNDTDLKITYKEFNRDDIFKRKN